MHQQTQTLESNSVPSSSSLASFSSSSIATSSSSSLASFSSSSANSATDQADDEFKKEFRPEYFEYNDPFTDSPAFLRHKQTLQDSLPDVDWYYVTIHSINHTEKVLALLSSNELSAAEKIRLLSTSFSMPSTPGKIGKQRTMFLTLVLAYYYSCLNNSLEIYRIELKKTIKACLTFLKKNASDTSLKTPIYNLFLSKWVDEETANTTSYSLVLLLCNDSDYIANFFNVLIDLQLSKPEYLALLGTEAGGQSIGLHISCIKYNLVTNDDSKDTVKLQSYLTYLHSLVKNGVFTHEDFLEALLQQSFMTINLFTSLCTNNNIKIFLQYFFETLKSIYLDGAPRELIRMYFNSCIGFIQPSKPLSELFLSQHLDTTLKSILSQNNALLIQAIASANKSVLGKKNPALDDELTQLQQLLQKEQDTKSEGYQLLRQDVYETLAGIIVSGQLLLSKTAKTIELFKNLLITLCDALSPEIASRYIFQLLSLNAFSHKLPLTLELCLPNDALTAHKDYLVPTREEQLINALDDLYNRKILTAENVFTLFACTLASEPKNLPKIQKPNFFSYTTTVAAQLLLAEVSRDLKKQGFPAYYLYRVYETRNKNGISALKLKIDQAELAHKIFTNTTSKVICIPFNMVMLELWFELDISIGSIFSLLTRSKTEDDSILFALTRERYNFQTLIHCLKLLIRKGWPEYFIIQRFTSNFFKQFINNYLHRYLPEEAIEQLFKFLAQIDPIILRNAHFADNINKAISQLDDLDDFASFMWAVRGPIIWYACQYGITNIGTSYRKEFLQYINSTFDSLTNNEKLINILLLCLDHNTTFGKYCYDESIREMIIRNLRQLALAETYHRYGNLTDIQFLVTFLQSRGIGNEMILRIINPNIHYAAPTLANFDPNRVSPRRYWAGNDTRTVVALPLSLTTTATTATTDESKAPVLQTAREASYAHYFEHHTFPIHLVQSDQHFEQLLIAAAQQITRICNTTYAKGEDGKKQGKAAVEQFLKQLKDNGFFKIIFKVFYIKRLTPEAMDNFFNFLSQMEQYLLRQGHCPEDALEDFLNPYLKEDTADQLEATGFLLWLKAKYNLHTAPKEGIYSKVLLLLFICNNFRDVKTQATLLLHCLDYNSSLGRFLRFPRHYLLAKAPVIGSVWKTSITSDVPIIAFKRLEYLRIIHKLGISRASVYSVLPKKQALIPMHILATPDRSSNLKSSNQGLLLQEFAPTLDKNTLPAFVGEAKEFGWWNTAQGNSILAYSGSSLPVEAGLITEERAEALREKEVEPDAKCCEYNPNTEPFPDETADPLSALQPPTTASLPAAAQTAAASSSTSAISAVSSSSSTTAVLLVTTAATPSTNSEASFTSSSSSSRSFSDSASLLGLFAYSQPRSASNSAAQLSVSSLSSATVAAAVSPTEPVTTAVETTTTAVSSTTSVTCAAATTTVDFSTVSNQV